MTREDIVRMAQEAGFEGCAELTWEDVICTEELVAFAKLVAQHEREACAKMCDYVYDNIVTDEHIKDMAFKIRARGQA
jgi:hypothetical protein